MTDGMDWVGERGALGEWADPPLTRSSSGSPDTLRGLPDCPGALACRGSRAPPIPTPRPPRATHTHTARAPAPADSSGLGPAAARSSHRRADSGQTRMEASGDGTRVPARAGRVHWGAPTRQAESVPAGPPLPTHTHPITRFVSLPPHLSSEEQTHGKPQWDGRLRGCRDPPSTPVGWGHRSLRSGGWGPTSWTRTFPADRA